MTNTYEMDEVLDITPETNLPNTLGKTGHKLQEALAELIDNSIDAMVDDEVNIDITVTDDEVIISDDGSGMDLEGLKKALTLGHSEKQGKLGKYGLGLKTSCFAMGDSFEIVTKKKGDEYEYRAIFDSKELANRKEWKLPYERRNADVDEHYTYITIDNLKIKNPLKKMDEVIDELQMRFSNFLEDKKENIAININGNKLEIIEIQVMPEHTIVFDDKKEANTNYGKITGWASLMPKGSQAGGKYGLHCYWNGRLIKQFNKIGFKSHATYAHVFGKINLDFVEVQHDKKDFITDSPEYREAEETMAILLKPLLKKSANFDKLEGDGGKKTRKKVANATGAIQKAISKGLKNNDISWSKPRTKDVYVGGGASKVTDEVKETLSQKEKNETVYTIELGKGEKINFSFDFKFLGEKANYLIYEYNPEENHLRILSNKDSTIYSACEDISFLSALHAAEGLARFILKSGNKENNMDEYFKLFTLIFEQTCGLLKD